MPSNGPLSTRQASAVGSQDSLLTLPPPLPAQPPRLGTLSLHPAASSSSSSASAADEWGSVFEVLESSRSTMSAEEGEVKALEDGLTKRRSVASKMTQELVDLQKRLQAAEERERELERAARQKQQADVKTATA